MNCAPRSGTELSYLSMDIKMNAAYSHANENKSKGISHFAFHWQKMNKTPIDLRTRRC